MRPAIDDAERQAKGEWNIKVNHQYSNVGGRGDFFVREAPTPTGGALSNIAVILPAVVVGTNAGIKGTLFSAQHVQTWMSGLDRGDWGELRITTR